MTRYMLNDNDVPILDACLAMQEIDTLCHRVLACRAEGHTYQECAKRFQKSRIWYAKKLAKCFQAYQACKPKAINLARAGELRQVARTEQAEELEQRVLEAAEQQENEATATEEEKREERVRTRSRVDPERQAESAALKKLGVIAAKQAEQLVALYQRIGQQFYERFKEIKEVLGIEWEELIQAAYETYIQHGIEREEITEEEIIATIIKTMMES